jgi:hypothetical protein
MTDKDPNDPKSEATTEVTEPNDSAISDSDLDGAVGTGGYWSGADYFDGN